ncbi:MAG TPA: hypothetical protein VFE65_30330 [Pseudonocardia sp.]|jgi:hypothetical protein|nr:hypothetical protein [Pseudonocardia sp.]
MSARTGAAPRFTSGDPARPRHYLIFDGYLISLYASGPTSAGELRSS